jgi:DNA sulfur modification protein DndD
MIFHNIELTNFRNFKDTKINFSIDPEKNVTFVTGEITTGKSTLLKAFLWCLYRINNFKDPILLMSSVAEKLKPKQFAEARVQIELEHLGVMYKVITSEEYTFDKKIVIFKPSYTKLVKVSKNGNSDVFFDDRADLEIADILRRDLSPYFFFDGETSDIENLVDKRSIKQAVTDIMGLKPFEFLKKVFEQNSSNGVYSMIAKELTSNDQSRLNELNNDLNAKNSELIGYQDDVAKIEEEIINLEQQANDIINDLEKNKDVEIDVEKKKIQVKKILLYSESINSDYVQLLNTINLQNYGVDYFISKVYSKFNISSLLMKSNLTTNKSLSNIEASAIDQIIDRKFCICGNEIKPGTKEHEHLIEQKNFIAPRDYGKAIFNFLETENQNLSKSNATTNNFKNIFQNLKSNIENIEFSKQTVQNIDNRIRGRKDVAQLREKLTDLESQIRNQSNIKSFKDGKIEMLSKDLTRINEEIRKLTKDTSGNELINLRLSYVNSVYAETIEYLERKSLKILKLLNSTVNAAFESMVDQERSIVIDENYNVKSILKSANANLDESSGLKTIKSFSFVGGLIGCTKIILKEEDSDEEIKLPLVMDAPFSKIGDNDIIRVSKEIPKMCDQIIIFVLNKDFQISKNSIIGKVGKQYEIIEITKGEHSEVRLVS